MAPSTSMHRPPLLESSSATASTSTSSRQLNVLIASSTPPNQCQWPSATQNRFVKTTLNQILDLDNVRLCDYTTIGGSIPSELRLRPDKIQSTEKWIASLCQWADLLVLLPWDANSLAHMLQGVVDDDRWLMLLRSWNVTKRILLVPGMNTLMWENPMTRKHLSKLKRKWNWVRVIPPILWDAHEEKLLPWDGQEELVESVRTAKDLLTIGQDVNITPPTPGFVHSKSQKKGKLPVLPPELWSMILEFTNDWELATALDVHTNLPIPPEWRQSASEAGPQNFTERLEWTILRGNISDVRTLLESSPPRWLSRLCIKLIMRFSKTALLAHLETHHKELFWETFGHAFLPDKASSVFGHVALLNFWHTSPSFLTKEYTAEALDGASRSGLISILSWWRASGLPLRYTEAALEQASIHGHLDVLEWWKAASIPDPNTLTPTPSSSSSTSSSPAAAALPVIKLKPGKSIAYATQSGSLPVLHWWAHSRIPFPHEDTVAKLASTNGHVHILEYWAALRGEKILYDHQVLVGATKMGHARVLEWWKRSGLRVEYKTCDIEEALEDGVEGVKGEGVRRWWARNGLNLGVGTSEWMRTKVLGQV